MASDSTPRSNPRTPPNSGVGRNREADMAAGSRYFNQYNTGGSTLDRQRGLEQVRARPDNNIPVLGNLINAQRNQQIKTLERGGSPVFDDAGKVQGVYGGNNRLIGGTTYTGNPSYGPFPNLIGANSSSSSSSQNSGPSPAEIAMRDARAKRAAALTAKQTELADAFNFFNDDYYDDMTSSYRDFASGSLQTAYDDALRGIYQGFKSQGMMSQGDLDQALAGLTQARADENARLDRLASEYSGSKRSAIDSSRKKFGDELSGLAGGATDLDTINKQIDSINAFDVAGRVDKLKAPGAKEAVDFFSGYNKVGAQDALSQNVAPTLAGGGSSVVNMGAASSPSNSYGISSPFQGGSTKVVGA